MTSKITSTDQRTFAFTYDDAATNGMNQLASVVATIAGNAPESQYAFGYDPYANTISTSVGITGESAPYVTATVFDPQKRVVQDTYPDATVLARDYSFGALVTQTLDGARADYPLEQYNPWQKAGALQFGNGIRTGYSFDPTGQVLQENVCGPNSCLLRYGHSYDLLNQLLEQTDLMDSSQSQSFGYANRRLTAASVPGFDNSGSYMYDAAGNFQTKDGVSFTYQAHYPVSGTAGGASVYAASYDACGRTSSRTINGTTYSFAYDGLGFLNNVRNAGGDTVRSLVSNYLGRLLRQTGADGTINLYIGPAFLVTRASGATKITKYLLDDRGTAASIVDDGSEKEVLYFRRDFKGSVTHAYDANAALVSQLAYDGYGNLLVVSGAEVRTKYEQREWDADLGLYYFGARYYDVFTGRFLTPDTRLGSDDMLCVDALNRFAFELNNPINNVDPTGHSVGTMIAGIFIGAVLLIAAAVITVVTWGAATPAVAAGIAAGVSALVGGGLNAIIYSATHKDESGGRFWGGFVVSVAVGAAIGAAVGCGGAAFGAGLVDVAAEKIATSMLPRGFLRSRRRQRSRPRAPECGPRTEPRATSAGDTFNQFMSNVVDKKIIGKSNVSLDDGLGRAAATGAVMGAIAGIGQAAVEFKYLKVYAQGPSARNLRRAWSCAASPVQNETTRLLPAANVRVMDTPMSRALLYMVSTSSLAVDASLEAAGY